MKKILRKGCQEFEILSWRDVRFLEFRDRFEAVDFLTGFLNDPYAVAHLRQILGKEFISQNIAYLNDHEVVEVLSDLLVAKKIRILARFDMLQPTSFLTEFTKEAVEPPVSLEEAYEFEEEPEPDELYVGVAEAQAETLIKSAEDGSPFCEA